MKNQTRDPWWVPTESAVTPRLSLVTPNWPDQSDTDQDYADDGNPIAAAFWLIVLTVFIGFLIWAAI